MVGITAYGVHIPRHRINRKTIFEQMNWLGSATNAKGEKAICNYDEDAITMAVGAAVNCLHGIERGDIEGVYFASGSSPTKDRQAAGTVSTALDLRSDIRTADFAGSTKGGTAAIIAACEAIKAGSIHRILSCASDCRVGKPGSVEEQTFGDAAAALLLGDSDVIASVEGFHSVSYDFMGSWMGSEDQFPHAWEARFASTEGYIRFIVESVTGLLKKYNLEIKDFAKVVYPCSNARDHSTVAAKLGLTPEQVQGSMFDTVGDSGNAMPLLTLAAALDEAKPGEKILMASYGNGSDALFLEVTDKITSVSRHNPVQKLLESKLEISKYTQYLAFRDAMPVEVGIRGEEADAVPTQVSRLWRERREIMGLCGGRCLKCGTPQYPYDRVCVNPDCRAMDEMEYYRFSDKPGTIFTYTADNLTFSMNPPAIYGMVDFEGGGRFWFDLTDVEPDQVSVGMPVEMSFRRKYYDKARGLSAYFWKAVPTQA